MKSPAGANHARSARQLSPRCETDAIAGWVVELLQAAYAGQKAPWPKRSRGMQSLSASDPLHLGSDGPHSAKQDLQEALSRRHSRHADAPISFVRVAALAGHISTAQRVICDYSWFLQPSRAVFVCAGRGEAADIETMLRTDPDNERNEDLFDAARRVAEESMAPCPGWRYAGPPPVLLADELPADGRWREVFLSLHCRDLPIDHLIRVLSKAEMGVHVLAAEAPRLQRPSIPPRP